MAKILLSWTLPLMMLSFFSLSVFCVRAEWLKVDDTVTGAYGEAVVGTGDVIYFARGGRFYRYMPTTGLFEERRSPPQPDGDAFKTGTALAWDFSNYVYALFGAATGDSRKWFYRYSISGDTWELLKNTTVDQGEGDAMTWVESQQCIYATIGGEQRLTSFMRYYPSNDSWSDIPIDPPEGMGDGASIVWTGGDFLYALRGEFEESSPLHDFWRYSISNNNWTVIADIPATPHGGGSGGVGDGGSLLYVGFWFSEQIDYIYALSGNQAIPDGIPDNRTYRYTISQDSWSRFEDLPFGIGHYVGCRFAYANGSIYVWQGTSSTWTNGGDDLVHYIIPEFSPMWILLILIIATIVTIASTR
ncbi:MAG: kelch repeat-containing protein [Candidatus Bathyarchaeota archaeon]